MWVKDVRKLGFILSHLERSVRKKETEVYLDFAALPLQVSFSPTCSDGCSSWPVAILELRKWGSHCRAKEKKGANTNIYHTW